MWVLVGAVSLRDSGAHIRDSISQRRGGVLTPNRNEHPIPPGVFISGHPAFDLPTPTGDNMPPVGSFLHLLPVRKGQSARRQEVLIMRMVKSVCRKRRLSMLLSKQVGVGDGPWDTMREFDDNIPDQVFDLSWRMGNAPIRVPLPPPRYSAASTGNSSKLYNLSTFQQSTPPFRLWEKMSSDTKSFNVTNFGHQGDQRQSSHAKLNSRSSSLT